METEKSFGEKAARNIEEKLGLQRGQLDQAVPFKSDESIDPAPQEDGESASKWPFQLVDQDLYLTLSEPERYQVQTHMQDEIKAILASRRLNGTSS